MRTCANDGTIIFWDIQTGLMKSIYMFQKNEWAFINDKGGGYSPNFKGLILEDEKYKALLDSYAKEDKNITEWIKKCSEWSNMDNKKRLELINCYIRIGISFQKINIPVTIEVFLDDVVKIIKTISKHNQINISQIFLLCDIVHFLNIISKDLLNKNELRKKLNNCIYELIEFPYIERSIIKYDVHNKTENEPLLFDLKFFSSHSNFFFDRDKLQLINQNQNFNQSKDKIEKHEKLKEYLQEFSTDYGGIVKNYLKNVNNLKSKFEGVFLREYLDFGFNNTNADVITEYKEKQSKLSSLFYENKLNYSEPISTKLIEQIPEILHIIQVNETITHEFFHFFQFTTLKIPLQIIESTRSLQEFRTLTFLFHLQHDGKWKHSHDDSIFSVLNDYPEEQVESFFRQLDIQNKNLAIIKEFNKRYDGVSANDLLEGEAFYFQKISNGSINIRTESNKVDSIYYRAFQEYKKAGGKDEIIFLLICNASLKNGTIDKEWYDYFLSPIAIFQLLLQHVASFEELLYKESNKFIESDCTSMYQFLDQYESIKNILSKFDSDLLKYFINLDNISKHIQKIIDDHLKESSKKSNYDDIPKIMDERIKIISEHLQNEFSLLFSDTFLLLLIFDIDIRSKFFKDIVERDEWKVKTILGDKTIREDKEFFRLVDDIIKVIDAGCIYKEDENPLYVYCCSKHNELCITDFEDDSEPNLYTCTNQDSINMKCKKYFNRQLIDLIE